MTPVDEAVERVREDLAHADAQGHHALLMPIEDLRALLSALELGRQAQQSPAGLGLHPSALQEPSASGWLIESREDGLPTWLSLKEPEAMWSELFTPDSSAALRFARREDAEDYVRCNLDDAPVYITEHGWAALADPRQPPATPLSDEFVARLVKRGEGYSETYRPSGVDSELDEWIDRYPHDWQSLVHTVSKVRRALSASTTDSGRLDAEARLHVEAETVCEPAGGWIEWAGGECPVPGQMVEWKDRDGPAGYRRLADSLRWTDEGDCADIIAYRLVTPAPPTGEGGGL